MFVTNGMKVRTDMGENARDGAMAALQWRPNDSFTSILDLYYTRREQEDNARSLEVNLSDYPAPCCDGTFPPGTVFGYSNPTIVDNTVVAATLNQRRAAGAQLPVQDAGQDPGGRLEQRVVTRRLDVHRAT